MSRVKATYKELSDVLEPLREYCSEMDKQGQPGRWKLEALAIQEALDIISDYDKVVADYNRMIRLYETPEKAKHVSTDVYICPNCGRRVAYNHSHCHWCGKRVGWGR